MIDVSSRPPLNNDQIQVILTSKFGDGNVATNSQAKRIASWNYNYYYSTNSIHLEYLMFKKQLLGNLCKNDIVCKDNNGYKHGKIFYLSTISHNEITEIAHESMQDTLLRMDDLGFALWIYDDGSLHRTKEFYNINTQKYSFEENNDIIVPFLKNKFDIRAIPTIERKKDGRSFWYLRVRKYEGAFIISEILRKHFVSCFNYKSIKQETIDRWKKFETNYGDIMWSLHPRTISRMLKNEELL